MPRRKYDPLDTARAPFYTCIICGGLGAWLAEPTVTGGPKGWPSFRLYTCDAHLAEGIRKLPRRVYGYPGRVRVTHIPGVTEENRNG
jgi:hypothetical protein